MKISLKNIKLGPKLMAAFFVVSMFSAVTGIYGITQLNNTSATTEVIRDQNWRVADSAMHLEFLMGRQLVILHEAMLEESEEDLREEFDAMTSAFQTEYSNIEAILGADNPMLTHIPGDYSEYLEISNGNETSEGVLDLSENKFQLEERIYIPNMKRSRDYTKK